MFRIQNPNLFFRVSALRHLFATLALASAFVSSLPAQPTPPAGRVSFFTELDYRGEVLVVEAGAGVDNLEFLRDSRGRPFNDRFRSVRLEGPIRVAVFEHSQFRGAATWLNRTTPDLTAFSLGQTNAVTWDRAISSIQIEAAPTGPVFYQWSARDADRALRAAYRDILNRDPDPDGLRFYRGRLLDAGWSEPQLRDALRRSDEFRSRDFGAIVRRVYREVLGREPDASGLSTYTRALSRGQTEAELRAELRRSSEGDALSVTAAITRAYRDILKRDPDPAGLDNYRRLVRDKAWNEDRIRADLRRSEEFRQLPK
jgi:hypothetical protein